MKASIKIFFLLFFNFLFSQKIPVNQFHQYDFEKVTPLMSYISSEIQKKYKEEDKVTKYDNLFRVNIVAGNYE